jgi:colanic acid/amylovoran/stewartan biosynthesis glycosyltransferase WcaL/AmsK/CpsK
MNHPLRIAMFVGSFPEPSETFILRQIGGLLDLGHEVDIYADTRSDLSVPLQPEVTRYRLLERTTFMDMPPECAPWELPAWPEDKDTWVPGASEPIPNRERLARAKAMKARCRERAPELTEQVLNEEHYGYRARSLSALYRLDRLSGLNRQYDVLHAHFGPVGESYRFARELWKAPLVVSFHGYDFSTVPRKEGRDCYARLFAAADLVTVNSDYTFGEVEKLGCRAAKLRKLPVGLNPSEFVFKERTFSQPVRLVTVARLVEIKGHEFCLRAMAEVRRSHPHLRYDVIGDGPLRKKLEVLTDELGLRDVVAFRGTKTGSELKALLEAAHLFLLCSVRVGGDREGQGLALQEAQACGLPVIATRHGAFLEGLLEGESGLLVPERDVRALGESLKVLLGHPERWPAMGRAGRRFVETRFDIRELNQQLQALYESAIHENRERRC